MLMDVLLMSRPPCLQGVDLPACEDCRGRCIPSGGQRNDDALHLANLVSHCIVCMDPYIARLGVLPQPSFVGLERRILLVDGVGHVDAYRVEPIDLDWSRHSRLYVRARGCGRPNCSA